MARFYPSGGAGGADTSIVTAGAGDILSGKVIVDADGNPLTGTLALVGDAAEGHVLVGKTFYNTDAKTKKTGTMIDQGAKTSSLNCGGSYTIPAGYHNGSGKVTANSLASQTDATATAAYIKTGYTAWVKGSKLTGSMAVTSAINFKATALSGSSIRISWTNPSKGPWQGVFIQMSTSGSPGTSGGTRVYTGTGVSTTASGSNYIDITGLSLATTYYFTCTSYCDALGWGSSYNVSATTKGYVLYNNGSNTGGLVKRNKTASYSDYWLLYASDDYQVQIPATDYSKYTKVGLVASFNTVNTAANIPGITFYNGSTYVNKVLNVGNKTIGAENTQYTFMFDISSFSLTSTIAYNILIRPWSTQGTYVKPTINMYKLWLE